MHEIGHNLRLSHAGDDSNTAQAEYQDQSGIMGFSYIGDNTPRMCFNGVKRYVRTTWEGHLVIHMAAM